MRASIEVVSAPGSETRRGHFPCRVSSIGDPWVSIGDFAADTVANLGGSTQKSTRKRRRKAEIFDSWKTQGGSALNANFVISEPPVVSSAFSAKRGFSGRVERQAIKPGGDAQQNTENKDI
jgi:hypothetical protein